MYCLCHAVLGDRDLGFTATPALRRSSEPAAVLCTQCAYCITREATVELHVLPVASCHAQLVHKPSAATIALQGTLQEELIPLSSKAHQVSALSALQLLGASASHLPTKGSPSLHLAALKKLEADANKGPPA